MALDRKLFGTWQGRALVATASLLVVLIMVGVGVLMANTYGASNVAANAKELHWTNATKGAAGIARASVAQAVFFSFEEVSDTRARESAIDEAWVNLEAVSVARDSDHSGEPIGTALDEFLETAEETITLAETGDSTSAETHRAQVLEADFQTLSQLLQVRQTTLAEAIAESDQSAGQISKITFVAIAFLIPAIAMLIFWLVLRRRMRIREAAMTARVEAEQELNKAKDELIAGLSHELRTPLTTIFGFSEILLDDPGVNGEAQELLSLINASSADLSRMVNDLLTAARLDADALTTSLEQFDLGEQVSAVSEPYRRSGEKLSTRVPSLDVYSDPLHVRQIVHNLISNALHHGGDEITVSAIKRKNEVDLIVADDGDGIPEDMVDDLFKRFAHQGREAIMAGSVGLGLAISQELASKLGGSLHYHRADGWTTFRLTLPATIERVDLDNPEVELAQTALAS